MPQDDTKRLYLVDAMALAYRAHFIFISRPLINSKGENTSATYGFTSALLKLIEDHGIDHIAVVFDAPGEGGTFRDELYEDYKAHRDPPPDDLLANLPRIKDVVRAMDIPVVEEAGVEADDVIGTLARNAERDGAEVVIVSPDKDFLQLLSDRVSIFRPAHRGEEFDLKTAGTFREKYELEPEQFIDMLALMGDTSDNVPGVPGIGEKTAAKLIREYGSVENLLEHREDVRGKRAREGLAEHHEDALLSKRLVTIKTDVPVEIDWHRLRRTPPDYGALQALFEAFEFRSFLKRVRSLDGGGAAPAEEGQGELFSDDPSLTFDFGPYEEVTAYDESAVDYRAVRTRAQLDALVEALAAQERFALDTETTSTDAMLAGLVGLSFAWTQGEAVYVPTPLPDGTTQADVLDALRPVLAGDALKIGQNLKYDLLVLAQHGLEVAGPAFDTMVAHYLLAPEQAHGLDDIASQFLSYRMIPITELIGTGKEQKSMLDVPLDQVVPYACEDADVTLRLYAVLRAKLEEEGLLEIAETMEFPLVPVLTDMERAGIRVDEARLREISAQLGAAIDALEAEIYELAGRTFNIGSTVQLGEVLFNPPPSEEERAAAERWAVESADPKAAGKTKKQLKEEAPTFGVGLESTAKTATGRPKTDENVLQELATEHPLPGLILDWRQLSKLKSTYVDSLGELVHPETGRIHTSFNQTVTATGRLSSSNPNLQNIPVRTERGREIRKAFVPGEGMLLMAADYVQIELRILAAMSGDENLKQAFLEGQDIHTAAAARVFGIAPDDVTRDQRRKAKEVNYGIPYGVSGFGLAQRLRSSVKEAQQLIDQYQTSYPGVSRFLLEKVEEARRTGYAETRLGRRRFVPNINARNFNERSFAERVAVNMPIQGTQADMIKLAMVRIHDRLKREGLRSRLLLQVHDELVFEVLPEEVDTLHALVEEEMVGALPLDVPVEVEINVADNWLDAH